MTRRRAPAPAHDPRRRRWLVALAAAGGTGCAMLHDANRPMNRIDDRLPDARGARHLLALLPGAWDTAQDFLAQGFVAEVRRRGLAADIVAVDSHVGYFNNGSIAERVHDEIVRPARDAGYRSVWLAGISLGGLGSMLCAARHGGVDGIVALAPYLATRDVIAEVRNAGGLAAWAAGRPAPVTGDWERTLLAWLAGYADPATRRERPPLLLGYGTEDRFADSLALLAQVLPAEQVTTVAGGHDWPAWRRLWTLMLERDATRIAPRLDVAG